MPRYVITEKAGRFVAGHTNTGAGTRLVLTRKAAEHEVRLGTLVPVDEPESPLPSTPVVVEPVAASASSRTVAAGVVVEEFPDMASAEVDPPEKTASQRRRKSLPIERHDDRSA